MSAHSFRRFATHLLLATASLAAVGCGDSSDGPGVGPDQQNNQTATATATPTTATIARGASAQVTVVYARSAGLIAKSTGIQKQHAGISVTQTTTQTNGTTITRVYTITADQTVPVGTHTINFTMAIDGYTGTGVPPTPKAVFSLVVTG